VAGDGRELAPIQVYRVMNMFQFDQNPIPIHLALTRTRPSIATGQGSLRSMEARVKPECVHLYPGVDPTVWYQVVQEGEYKDDLEGLWIQVTDWVTYVLAKHFDVKARPELH
jgi:hypothetical protein